MVEKRPDRGQPRITCLNRVLPGLLEIVQECEDIVAIEIGDRQFTRLSLRALGDEQDQHAQCVAIAGEGRMASIALLCHPLAKEGLQQRREGGMRAHTTPPPTNARSAAMPSRSAAAVT